MTLSETQLNAIVRTPEYAEFMEKQMRTTSAPTEDHEDEDKKPLQDKGFYFLFDDIYAGSVLTAIEWILETNLKRSNRPEFLTMCINSPGGDMTSAFALIDVMRGSSIPIHTVGLGMIASAGLSIFMAGKKGKRMLTPNTSILSHQYTWGTFGKEHELFAAQKEYDLTTERMINHYRKCTGIADDDIRNFLLPPHDVWLSSNEALKYGICDEVKEMS
jgi:ATP-dependent Clp protease protease subunit